MRKLDWSKEAHPPWVLHAAPTVGVLTERWINLQSQPTATYDSRLLGLRAAPGASREPHWLLAQDRWDTYLAYRGMRISAGVSPVALAQRFRSRPPEAIHAHFGPVAARLRLFAKSLNRPLLTSFYGFDATTLTYVSSRRWRRRYRRLFDATAFCIVEGPRMAERVATLGCPEDKIRVVRLPADANLLRGIEYRPSPRFRVVLAGRLVEKKGFDTAIHAYARAFSTSGDTELVVLGDGPLAGDHRRLARSLGLSNQVSWAGTLNFDSFMRHLATAHVVLFPSRTAANGDSEGGAPVALIEAQWIGVPCLVSRHDDLPFVVPHNALTLPPTAIDEWADALRHLYAHPGLLDSQAAAAQTFAREAHSPELNQHHRHVLYGAANA